MTKALLLALSFVAAAPVMAQSSPQEAIPDDDALDPSDEAWEVVLFEDDGDGEEDLPDEFDDSDDADEEGYIGYDPADIPTLRRPSTQSHQDDDDDQPHATGGRPIPDRGAPWQAQIFGPFPAERFPPAARQGNKPLWQLQHYCGGVLVAPNWVLTAAHCIDEEMVKLGYKIRLGSEDISRDPGVVYRIERIVRHAGYTSMYVNDIALIRIAPEDPRLRPAPNQVRPLGLYRGAAPPRGTSMTVTGWGKTEDVEGDQPAALLMKVDLEAMSTSECQALPGYGPQKVHPRVLCASAPGRATCRGDSGGPMVFTHGTPVLVGLVSWGKTRCAGDGLPGVYTLVAPYSDWIDRAMRLTDPAITRLP
jgi:hypothetical protein